MFQEVAKRLEAEAQERAARLRANRFDRVSPTQRGGVTCPSTGQYRAVSGVIRHMGPSATPKTTVTVRAQITVHSGPSSVPPTARQIPMVFPPAIMVPRAFKDEPARAANASSGTTGTEESAHPRTSQRRIALPPTLSKGNGGGEEKIEEKVKKALFRRPLVHPPSPPPGPPSQHRHWTCKGAQDTNSSIWSVSGSAISLPLRVRM